jgi:hypothetical protein
MFVSSLSLLTKFYVRGRYFDGFGGVLADIFVVDFDVALLECGHSEFYFCCHLFS